MRSQISRSSIATTLLFALLITPAAAKVRVGDRLPDIALDTWQGQATSLSRQSAPVVVVDFWASWCVVCREALPALSAMNQRYAARGLVTIGINIDQKKAAADGFLAEHLPHTTLTLLRDSQAQALARFGADGMPALYVVDRTGVVKMVEVGYTPDRLPAIERLVESLLDAPADSTPLP